MATSEAQKRAVKKYRAQYTSDISMTVPKEVKAKMKEAAAERGMSLQGFILQCVSQVIDLNIGS